jgi:hypothetical protein
MMDLEFNPGASRGLGDITERKSWGSLEQSGTRTLQKM